MKNYYKIVFFLLAAGYIFFLNTVKAEEVDKDVIFKKMAEKLSAVAADLNKKTVAVYGFEMIGRDKDSYSIYATEKLTHELVETGKLMIIERSRINKLLNEQQLSMSGLINADMAAKIGKILSVEGVVIGSISVRNNEVELIARVIQSESAVILKSVNMSYKTDSAFQAGSSGTGNVMDNTTTTVTVPATGKKGNPNVVFNKSGFLSGDTITINYSGMPGNRHDWITLVEASKSDEAWGQWFYTQGQQSGQYIFPGVPAGEYEVRVYYNWPAGGYIVQKRFKVTVK